MREWRIHVERAQRLIAMAPQALPERPGPGATCPMRSKRSTRRPSIRWLVAGFLGKSFRSIYNSTLLVSLYHCQVNGCLACRPAACAALISAPDSRLKALSDRHSFSAEWQRGAGMLRAIVRKRIGPRKISSQWIAPCIGESRVSTPARTGMLDHCMAQGRCHRLTCGRCGRYYASS